jgi:fructose-1,6-bisphosphatase/inositol monophosphatase family enzyme
VTEWTDSLRSLCGLIRDAAREALVSRTPEELSAPLRLGAGDVTFGIDEITERAVDRWLEGAAAQGPLSLLTEDAGWRHRGPGGDLPGFDHGGPRIALDPIDGTRNLMADLRPAWTVVSYAPPGPGQPRLADLTLGLVSEIPVTTAGRYRVIQAEAGGPCQLELRELAAANGAPPLEQRTLRADADDRPDRGYFVFFRYDAELRPALARLEADFFARLADREGADLHHCYDDQWCCGAGWLVSLATGTYRTLVDVRGLAGRRAGMRATTGHPYDVAGAILCARAAGCVVEDVEGKELEFPLDCETPLDLVAWTNRATRERLRPHLDRALEANP